MNDNKLTKILKIKQNAMIFWGGFLGLFLSGVYIFTAIIDLASKVSPTQELNDSAAIERYASEIGPKINGIGGIFFTLFIISVIIIIVATIRGLIQLFKYDTEFKNDNEVKPSFATLKWVLLVGMVATVTKILPVLNILVPIVFIIITFATRKYKKTK